MKEKILKCPICSGTVLDTIETNHKLDKFRTKFILKKCFTCEHVFIKNRPTDKELKKYYSKDFWENKVKTDILGMNWIDVLKKNPGSLERFIRAKKQLKYISDYINLDKNAKIIDIGSGFAPILYHFNQNKFTNLHALELDKNICNYLEKQGVIPINMQLEELALNNKKFDLIVLSHTLEHVSNPKKFIKAIKKISNANALIFIEVPYQDFLEPFNENVHLHFFSQKSLLILLHDFSFQVMNEEADTVGFIDRIILYFLYKIYGRFFAKKGKSINSSLKVVHLLHFIWRPMKVILLSKINIFISRKDMRVIAKLKNEQAQE